MISWMVSMMASTGVWLLLDDDAKHMGVPLGSERQFKSSSALDVSGHIEHDVHCSSVASFCNTQYWTHKIQHVANGYANYPGNISGGYKQNCM